MKSKKTEKSNLEKKTTLFFQMGIVIVIAGMLVAFESGSSTIPGIVSTDYLSDNIVEEQIQNTRPEIKKPKPPVFVEDILIIKDAEIDVELPEDLFNVDIDPLGDMDIFDFTEEEAVDGDPFIKVEKMPSYMGGDETKFQKHLQQLVIYPTQAIELGIGGRVLVNFVIDKNGNLTQPTIFRSPDILLSNAVLSAIEKTKKWKPGEQRNIKVPVQFTIPINFQLQ
jgi:periplasmic protein TonB